MAKQLVKKFDCPCFTYLMKKLEVHNFWSLFQFPYQNENFIQLFFQRKKLEANIFWSIFHIFINNFRSKFLKEFK